ncbi:unnamed protein product [Urochloa decumbens]|uniref:Uncharacterized protein n=1 Tax=Urochloa decumbens TaxID=240449 RepID=A0ABC8XE68_9POAL
MESATSSAAETAPPLAADTVDLAGELIDALSSRGPPAPAGRNQRRASGLGLADGLDGEASARRCLGRLECVSGEKTKSNKRRDQIRETFEFERKQSVEQSTVKKGALVSWPTYTLDIVGPDIASVSPQAQFGQNGLIDPFSFVSPRIETRTPPVPFPTQAERASERRRRAEKMVRKAKVEFDELPPDNFDPKNPYGDPVAMLEYREHLVREKWIQIETAKIIRERLRWCYRIEGINHHKKCRHLVEEYLEATRGVGWGKDARPPEFHGPKPFMPRLLSFRLLSSGLIDWLIRLVLLVRRAQEGRRCGVAALLLPLLVLLFQDWRGDLILPLN